MITWRQASGSTKSILKSGLKPVTVATAEKNLSGAIPHAARSISDQLENVSFLASDPNSITLFAPYCCLNNRAAFLDSLNAFVRRSSKYPFSTTRAVILFPGLNFCHSSGPISKAVGICYFYSRCSRQGSGKPVLGFEFWVRWLMVLKGCSCQGAGGRLADSS